MEESVLTTVFIPSSLVIIMLGMGLSLEPGDFARLVQVPAGVAAGLVAQLVLVPLAGFLVVELFPAEPVLATGVVIIAVCPGGAVSNLICLLARGNVALSVTLTAASSIATVFTIPWLVNAATLRYLGSDAGVTLPVLKTSVQLASVTMLPVVVGMLIRSRWRSFAIRSEGAVKALSALFLLLVIVAAVGGRVGALPHWLRLIGLQLVALNLLALSGGWLLASAMSLSIRDRITISIEAGIQNSALGIAIPATLIGNPEMAIPPAIYGLLMIFTASSFIAFRNRIPEPPTTDN